MKLPRCVDPLVPPTTSSQLSDSFDAGLALAVGLGDRAADDVAKVELGGALGLGDPSLDEEGVEEEDDHDCTEHGEDGLAQQPHT